MNPHDDSPRRGPHGDDLDDALEASLAEVQRQLRAILRDEHHCDEGDGLVDLAATLDGLVDRIVADSANADRADLDAIVDRCAQDLVHDARAPVTVRQSLHGRLPQICCRPEELAHAVRRALDLCVGNAGHGGEVTIRTALHGDQASLELHSDGAGDHVVERALTLRAFAKACGGTCRVTTDGENGVALSMQFPLALERR